MPQPNCVSRQELSDYCLGTLAPDRADAVADHVERCSACDETLRQFEAQGDPMLSTVRSALSDEYLREPQLARVLQLAGANLAPAPGEDRIGHRSHHAPRDADAAGVRGHHAERDVYGGVMRQAGASPPPATTAETLDAGDRLRDYRLLAKLGEGGMGTVFEAVHTHLDKIVAIKILPGDRMRDPHCVARFQREMRAVGKLDHPNLVRALDAGEDRGRQYLVMELVDGLDLACVSHRRGPLAAADACELARQAALGLDYAHRHGLVHRDIKPSNLMLTADGQVKVLDLGLALLHDDAPGHELTATHQLMGTAEFMAPEQTGNSHAVDARADLYSLGCTLYKLLTGESPFGGPAYATRLQKMLAHVQAPVPPLSAHRSDLPDGLSAIVGRLLAKQPGERYATGSELAAALAPFCAGADLPALFRAAWDATASQSVEKLGAAAQQASHSVETDPYLTSPAAGTDGDIEKGAGDLGLGAGDIKHVALPPSAVEADAALDAVLPGDDRSPHAPREANHHAERDVYGGQTSNAPIRRRPPGPRRLLALASAAALLAGVVFYVQTNHGTLRVEINDAQIEVAIKGDDITFKQADNGADVKLSPGEKTLIVERGDFKFETDKLVLKRGDIVTVAVTLVGGNIDIKQGDRSIGHKAMPTGWQGWPADAPAPAIAPFDAAQARKHQQEWADYLHLPVEYTNSIGMKLVLIPPGEFTMGSTATEIDEALKRADLYDSQWEDFMRSEGPQHKVVLTQPVYVGALEVSQEQYKTILAKTAGEEITPSHPAAPVDWNDAAEFCAKLSEKENLTPSYFVAGEMATPLSGSGYRLPTEAEWEFSCRAGTNTKFWVGDDSRELIPAAWFDANSGGRFHPIGQLRPNPFGLFDVHGNVWEWVDEWWHPGSYENDSKEELVVDPTASASSGLRVIRGGDWNYPASRCGSASRRAYPARGGVVGFRVVLPARASHGFLADVEERKKVSAVVAGATDTKLSRDAADPNAEVFDWVNEIGGRHGLYEGAWRPAALADVIKLADGSGGPVLWHIDLNNCQSLSSADLQQFRRVTKPFVLKLASTNVTDAGLAELHDLPLLEILELADTQVTGKGLDNLGVLPNLFRLSIDGSAISGADLVHCSKFPKLSMVDLGAPHLTPRGVEILSTLASLNHIQVLGPGIGKKEIERAATLTRLTGFYLNRVAAFDNDCLKYLRGLPNLKTLTLGATAVTDAGMPELAVAAPHLYGLQLHGIDITDAGLKPLGRLTALSGLDIRDTRTTAAGVAELQAALPNCKIDWSPRLPPATGDPNRGAAEWVLATGGEVYVLPAGANNAIHVKHSSELPDGPWQLSMVVLRGPWVRDDDFRRLANLQALHGIGIDNCNITGGGLAQLRGLPNLEMVRFVNSPVGDAGPALLNKFPSVTSIVLANTGTTDAGLEHIGRHRRLAGLSLGGNRGVTDIGLAHLRRLYALRDLDLPVTAITDAGLQHLRDLKQLRVLALQETDITDDGLEALGNLKNLKDLNLGGNVITDVGMPHIAKLTSLERLHLNRTHVGDDGVEQLHGLTKLEELYLNGTELTDEGLKHLRALTSLKVLNVQDTQVTASGVAELQAALPGCQIEWSDPSAQSPAAK